MKELLEGIKELKFLMDLDLSGFGSLKELPKDIKESKSLMHLNLLGSESLKELPESIKELKSLLHLNLLECGSLKKLPKGIKELKSDQDVEDLLQSFNDKQINLQGSNFILCTFDLFSNFVHFI